MEQLTILKNGVYMNAIEYVDPRLIKPNPDQPRHVFSEEGLEELKESIRREGLLQPIVAKKDGAHYQLVAGERRLRAALSLGLREIPVFMRPTNDAEDLLKLALIENVHRENLSVIEQAKAYAELIGRYKYTQERCSEEMGKPRSVVSNLLRLLSLPDLIQQDVQAERLSYGHAKALLGLQKHELMIQARNLILQKDLSVRETEKLCKKLRKTGLGSSEQSRGRDPNLEYLATRLREMLRTKVVIKGKGQRGTLEISYFSAEELERIIGLIKNSTNPHSL